MSESHVLTAEAETSGRLWRAAIAADGAAIVLPGQLPSGGEILSILLKRSYLIRPGQRCQRADADTPLIPGDVFWDSPANSSVRYETDFAPYKERTDVVFIARAHTPGGRPTEACGVAVQVGPHAKRILVTGKRLAKFVAEDRAPVFTDPEPFVELGMRYERAYGGIDVHSDLDRPCPYPRNPLGRGFVVKNLRDSVEGLLLPNLEDPADLLTPERLCVAEYEKWPAQPMPAGIAWWPRVWQPRCLRAGILPADRADERELRAAYGKLVPPELRQAYLDNGLPDMDFAFFNGAAPGLATPFLRGDEAVATENLSPEGRLDFSLPGERPELGLDIGFGIEVPPVVLHTVEVHLEERRVDLVWRAAVSFPGRAWLPQMRRMNVLVA